jgi:hypothetical protein
MIDNDKKHLFQFERFNFPFFLLIPLDLEDLCLEGMHIFCILNLIFYLIYHYHHKLAMIFALQKLLLPHNLHNHEYYKCHLYFNYLKQFFSDFNCFVTYLYQLLKVKRFLKLIVDRFIQIIIYFIKEKSDYL